MSDIPAFPTKGSLIFYLSEENKATVEAEGTKGLAAAHQGMTLRDYFAAKALQGLLSQSLGSAMNSSLTEDANLKSFGYLHDQILPHPTTNRA